MLDSVRAYPCESQANVEPIDFDPPWWLRSGHAQTIFLAVASFFAPKVVYERERWRTPKDDTRKDDTRKDDTPKDDFIDLDWLKSTLHHQSRALHVIFHGLASDSNAAPIRELVSAIESRGERAVVVHFRGCSGVPNRQPRGYHSADSDEIDWILKRIRDRHPSAKVFAIGYSLGGAALLKWLGETERNSAAIIDKAVAVSAPVDLRSAANAASRGFVSFYSRHSLRSLRRATLRLIKRFPELQQRLDVEMIRGVRTLARFDKLVTAPLHGFTLEQYYERSANHGLGNVVVPTLLIAAQNDPIVTRASMTKLQYSPAVRVDHQKHGGHTAFYHTAHWRIVNWVPQRALTFLAGRDVTIERQRRIPQQDLFGTKSWLATVLPSFKEALTLFLLRWPALHRFLFGTLRRFWPVYRRGATTFVTSARHVHEVLNRPGDFLLGPVNERKVLVGDFLLSLDPGRKYDTDKALIRSVFLPGRVRQMELCASAAAFKFLDSIKNDNRIDVVRFAECVTVEVASSFWGLESTHAQSAVLKSEEGAETLRLWLRYLGSAIAAPGNDDSGALQLAQRCRNEFVCFVQDACQAPNPLGVLGALVAASPDMAARNAAGIIMTASIVVTKAFVNAFVEIMKRPAVLAVAIDAANDKDEGREALAKIIVEALRFNPVFPFLARYCPRETSIRTRGGAAITIPAGSNVIVSALAAMFDPEALVDPARFQAGRDLQLNPAWVDEQTGKYGCPHAKQQGAYFHFSSGGHRCPADQLAIAEVTAMMQAVLTLKNLRLAGRLRYDGVAADELLVSFDT